MTYRKSGKEEVLRNMSKLKSLCSEILCPSWTVMAKRYWFHRNRYYSGHLMHNWDLFMGKVLAHKACGSVPFSERIKPFNTPHGLLGIVIHKDAIIGDGCTIFQFVTIGKIEDIKAKRSGVPTIGNNVYIGAGSTIVGGCHIGNNVKIGAGCTISEDIDDNATVVTHHPRIIVNDRNSN